MRVNGAVVSGVGIVRMWRMVECGKDTRIAGEIMQAAKVVAREAGVGDSGYRLVFNTGPDSLQSVFHIHGHLIGGTKMGWPPFPGESIGHG